MKKAFKLAAIAMVAMAMTVACNNKAAEVEEVALEAAPVEELVEEVVEEPIAKEEPAKEAAAPAKKEEAKPVAKAEKPTVQIQKIEPVKKDNGTVTAVASDVKEAASIQKGTTTEPTSGTEVKTSGPKRQKKN